MMKTPERLNSLALFSSQRAQFALIGALAWLAFYYIGEYGDLNSPRLDNLRFAFLWAAFVFANGCLLLAGPLGWRRALLCAAPIALISAFLFWSKLPVGPAGRQYFGHLNSASTIGAFLIPAIIISFPFLASYLETGQIFRYQALFRHAWLLILRGAISGIFAGIGLAVAWGLAYALKGVNLPLLFELLDEHGELNFTVYGAFLGIALAVSHEAEAIIATLRRLFLMLAVIFVPIFALASIVIALRLPFSDLRAIFGDFSLSATLILLVMAAVALISMAHDRRDLVVDDEAKDETKFSMLALLLRVYALSMTPLAGFALYGVLLRIGNYGLTPARILALIAAAIACFYALGYLAALVLKGRAWADLTRRVNIIAALGFILLSIAVFIPQISFERLSARSQLARFERGVALTELPLVELYREWGRAGRKSFDIIDGKIANSGDKAAIAVIEGAKEGRHPTRAEHEAEDEAERRATLRENLRIYDEEGAHQPQLTEIVADSGHADIALACSQKTGRSNPACAGIVANFVAEKEGEPVRKEVLLFWVTGSSSDFPRYQLFVDESFEEGELPAEFFGFSPAATRRDDKAHEFIDKIHAGDFSLRPSPTQELYFGDELFR